MQVQSILDDFRQGRRDDAEFWIQLGGKFIHICYFAICDENGIYQGTLEVNQYGDLWLLSLPYTSVE